MRPDRRLIAHSKVAVRRIDCLAEGASRLIDDAVRRRTRPPGNPFGRYYQRREGAACVISSRGGTAILKVRARAALTAADSTPSWRWSSRAQQPARAGRATVRAERMSGVKSCIGRKLPEAARST